MSEDQRILYEDDSLKVTYRNSEEHEFLINEGTDQKEWVPYILYRGFLKEFSRNSPEYVQRKIYNANPFLWDHLSRKNISSEKIVRVLAQSRINELEEEVSYFIDQYNRAKELIE